MLKRFSLFILIPLLVICFISCETNSGDTPAPSPTPPAEDFFSVYYDITSLPVSNAFAIAESTGTVQNTSLDEISGVAASASKSNSLWVEEDSGNENKIYLMGTTGKYLGSFKMTSLNNRDWEDMSIAPGPTPKVSYIYLADIGDNNKANRTKYIYRFPEPAIPADSSFSSEITTVDKISFNYPDGSKNSEAIMVDPNTNDIYVVSKEGQAVIYVARYPQNLIKEFTMTKVGVLPITDVTAADISPDGKEILIKNYTQILYWKKSGNETITELLQKTPQRAPYQIEEKGESICWAADGSGYYTTSELSTQPIYFYKRK